MNKNDARALEEMIIQLFEQNIILGVCIMDDFTREIRLQLKFWKEKSDRS